MRRRIATLAASKSVKPEREAPDGSETGSVDGRR